MPTASDVAAPVVSVIMAAHNSAPFIVETIESVQSQDFAAWELLVVDDCSTDDTVAIVERLADRDDRIQITRLESNGGAAVARNTAIGQARGRYIAFLDSDDIWLPTKLTEQITFMRDTGSPFTYTAYQRISEQGYYLGTVDVPGSVGYSSLLKRNVIACLTAIYDREHFGTTMMPLIRKGQDYGLWLLLLKRGTTARGLDRMLGSYRVRSHSISSNKLESSTWVWRIYRQVAALSLPTAIYYFAHYAFAGIGSRVIERLKKRSSGTERQGA